jgi:hypothetical protein
LFVDAVVVQSCTGGGIVESVASTVLGMFYSLTDANGILGRTWSLCRRVSERGQL